MINIYCDGSSKGNPGIGGFGIAVIENNIYRDRITLVNEETSHTFTIDPAKKYRYIVKLVGTFTEENQETGRTSTVTSEGVIVNVE